MCVCACVCACICTCVRAFLLAVCDPMSAQHGAIKMLLGRVLMLLEYVEAVKEGSLVNLLFLLRNKTLFTVCLEQLRC